MIFVNGTITRYRRCTGTTGAGEAVLVDVPLAMCIPCEVVTPSDGRIAAAQSVQTKLERLVRVYSRALRIAGITPRVEDRITVRTTRPSEDPIGLELTSVKAHGTDARVTELGTAERRDGQ